MEIRFLGVHNLESVDTKLISLLIDGVLVVDAGSITTTLSFEEQQRIKSILITHHHFDHIRDLATFGLANLDWGTKNVYSIQPVLDVIKSGLLNGTLYPDLTQIPTPDDPSYKMHALEEYKQADVDGYNVLPLPMEHGIPTVGYYVADKEGKSVFYSSDTTHGIEKCWEYISPDLLAGCYLVVTELYLDPNPSSASTVFLLKSFAMSKGVKSKYPPLSNPVVS